MYKTYFGFEQIPFNTNLDPQNFFYGASARKSEGTILNAIKNRNAAMFLYGDPGVGKTALVNRLAYNLSQTHQVVFPKQQISRIEPIIDCLYQVTGSGNSEKTVREKFNILRDCLTNSKTPLEDLILIIDDAHDLSPTVIGWLLALAQSGNESVPSFRLLFSGSSALKSFRTDPALQQFNLQEACWCRMESLIEEEVSWFINQKLELAGYRGKSLFSDKAIGRIIDYSEGNIGKISILCGFTLLNASLEDRGVVTEDIVNEAAKNCLLSGGLTEIEAIDSTSPRKNELLNSMDDLEFANQVDNQEKTEFSEVTRDYRNSDRSAQGNVDIKNLTSRYEELGIPVPDIGGDCKTSVKNRIEKYLNWKLISELFGNPVARYGVITTSAFIVLIAVVSSGYSFYSDTPVATAKVSPDSSTLDIKSENDAIQSVSIKDTEREASATDPNSQDNKIQAMLRLAESQVASQRFFAPGGDNALETYAEIAKLVENQLQTLNDLVQIKQLYQRWGLEAETQGDWVNAEKFYNQAINLSPHDEELMSAIERVKKQQMGVESDNIKAENRDLTTVKEDVLVFQS